MSSYAQLEIICSLTVGGPIQLYSGLSGVRMSYNIEFIINYAMDSENRDSVVA